MPLPEVRGNFFTAVFRFWGFSPDFLKIPLFKLKKVQNGPKIFQIWPFSIKADPFWLINDKIYFCYFVSFNNEKIYTGCTKKRNTQPLFILFCKMYYCNRAENSQNRL